MVVLTGLERAACHRFNEGSAGRRMLLCRLGEIVPPAWRPLSFRGIGILIVPSYIAIGSDVFGYVVSALSLLQGGSGTEASERNVPL
jgi:hypothetical protein